VHVAAALVPPEALEVTPPRLDVDVEQEVAAAARAGVGSTSAGHAEPRTSLDARRDFDLHLSTVSSCGRGAWGRLRHPQRAPGTSDGLGEGETHARGHVGTAARRHATAAAAKGAAKAGEPAPTAAEKACKGLFYLTLPPSCLVRVICPASTTSDASTKPPNPKGTAPDPP